MLESGLPLSAVVLRLQARFHCCRQSAYAYCHEAEAELSKSDDGPSQAELSAGFDPAELQAALSYDISCALAEGDADKACKLIAALDKVKRWHGQGQPESRWH